MSCFLRFVFRGSRTSHLLDGQYGHLFGLLLIAQKKNTRKKLFKGENKFAQDDESFSTALSKIADSYSTLVVGVLVLTLQQSLFCKNW